jgi:hypothetical protein
MVEFLQSIGTKIVAAILASSAIASGALATAQTKLDPPPETASIVSNLVVSHVTPAPAPTVVPFVPAVITPNLLPAVAITPTSTTAKKIKKSAAVAVAIATSPKSTPTASPTVATPTITAQWLLDNTKLSFRPNFDGTLKGIFTATVGAQPLTWGVDDQFIGGTNGIPQFVFSFSCTPVPVTPPSNASDQTPFFTVRTSYDCTIGFAATVGTDRAERSKDMKFTTGTGQLAVTLPPTMDAVLANGTNNGGVVFTNTDSDPITITGLTLDISYQGLSTIQGPLTLHFLDPVTSASLFNYDMETVPAVTGVPFSYATTGVTIPLSFTIPAGSPKLLPLQILGAHLLNITGLNPTITLTLQNVTTNATDVPVIMSAKQIEWSCTVALTGYDPNATSGPYADGTVCR